MEYTNRQILTFQDYMSKVFTYTAIGIGISALIAWFISDNYFLIISKIGYDKFSIVTIAAIVAELGLALFFGAGLNKMEVKTAWICYCAYCACTGLSLSCLLLAYTATSVVMALVMTSVVFASLAVIGHNTKVDVTKFSTLLGVSLIVVIIGSLLNSFVFKSESFSLFLCYISVIIFMGLIIYDTKRLRLYYDACAFNDQMMEKYMIFGAFQLYLDFINLFIRILQIFGKRKD